MKSTDKIEPIKPKEIIDNLDCIIHPAIIKAVNELLKEKYRGQEVGLKQKEIISRATKLCPEIKKDEIFEKKWMDFESIFRKAGWNVEYNSPDRDEDFEEYFKFSAKK